MSGHIVNGEFQSDKYPNCPRGKVPLSVRDVTAQDLLWKYAQRRRIVDAGFSEDLEACLRAAGFVPAPDEETAAPINPKSALTFLESKAQAAEASSKNPWWHTDSALLTEAGASAADRAHITANSPPMTLALIARIRRLEAACRCAAVALRIHDPQSPTAVLTDDAVEEGLALP